VEGCGQKRETRLLVNGCESKKRVGRKLGRGDGQKPFTTLRYEGAGFFFPPGNGEEVGTGLRSKSDKKAEVDLGGGRKTFAKQNKRRWRGDVEISTKKNGRNSPSKILGGRNRSQERKNFWQHTSLAKN